jgi:hypothetical protein
MRNRLPKLPKRLQFARKCIFCEANNANSREHFYSEWMHGLLPVGPQGTYTGEIIDEHPKTRAVSRHDKRVKPGELHTKKMKVVCRICNNEWMSGIEDAAKPLLTPLIKGDAVTLDAAQLEIVAKWATLKVIVCEHDNRGTEVTPQADRTAFMADGVIPGYFNIYLLSHNCASRVGYVRTSQTVSMTNGDPVPPLEGRTKNTQQISVILGSVMLHINAARVDGFMIENNLNMPAVVGRRIWPPNVTPLTWPGDPVLTCDQMRDLAYAMDKIMALPRANWGGDLPAAPAK